MYIPNMEDEPMTSRGLSAFCKIEQIFWSLLFISVTIAAGLSLYTSHQVYQGKEFTAREVVYTTAIITVCLVTIAAALTCRMCGTKMDKTTTKGSNNKNNIKRKLRKLNELCGGIVPTFLRKQRTRTEFAEVTIYEGSSKMAPEITGHEPGHYTSRYHRNPLSDNMKRFQVFTDLN